MLHGVVLQRGRVYGGVLQRKAMVKDERLDGGRRVKERDRLKGGV